MVSHGPTFLPSPGVTQLPNFPGTVLAGDYIPSQGTLPLCVFHCFFIPQATSSIQVSPGAGLASLLWERRELQSYNRWPSSSPKLLWQLQSLAPGPSTIAAVVPVQVPKTFLSAYAISLLSVFQCHLQSLSSKLLISWDSIGFFTLFFWRLARCPSWVHKQVGSAPTYLTAIFCHPKRCTFSIDIYIKSLRLTKNVSG